MINWKFEVEDVACPVDDMKTTDCSRSFVQRRWGEGRENKGSGYELMMQMAQGCGDPHEVLDIIRHGMLVHERLTA